MINCLYRCTAMSLTRILPNVDWVRLIGPGKKLMDGLSYFSLTL